MTNLFQSNREIIYLVYGEAFFVLGLAIALQSRKHSRLALARHLWLLAAFGIVHGIYEWVGVFIPTQPSSLLAESANFLRIFQMTLEAISFLVLFQFGIELLALGSPAQGLIRGLPTVLLGIWEATMLILQSSSGQSFSGYFDTGDTLARYLLGVPGAAAAAWGLWRQAYQVNRMKLPRIANYLRGAAYAFAIFAVTNVIVPSANFSPASLLNGDTLLSFLNLPAQIFRAGCGVVIAYLIIRGLEIFDVETDRMLEEAAQSRAVAADRERIGRELHDNIIQSLYATGLTLQDATLTVDQDAARAKDRIADAIQSLDEAIHNIRSYILDLRESGSDDWQADLQDMVRAFRLQTLLDVELITDSLSPNQVDAKEGKEILAIAREALTNITKHAQATLVRVSVLDSDGTTRLEIVDNGVGIDHTGNGKSDSHDRHGLRNMRERAALIGGQLEIDSAPERGTTVRLILPNEREANREME